MTDELRELYQDVILDHNKSPRNYGTVPDADRTIEAYNPLCGDHYTVSLSFEGAIISAIRFHGSGCAISKASASVMTTMVQGKTRAEAEKLFAMFTGVVTGKVDPLDHLEELGRLAAFAGVREFPARVKCASLAWHTLHAAIATDQASVSTE